MFSKGEYVVYATNGVCCIEDIAPMRNSEDNREYFMLRPVGSTASILYVPTDNSALCAKIRYVYSESELNNILNQVKKECFDWIDDRKTRISTFKDILHSGDIKSLVLLTACIQNKKAQLDILGKRLSDADDSMLRAAERIVNCEFAWVLGIERSDVAKYITEFLSK